MKLFAELFKRLAQQQDVPAPRNRRRKLRAKRRAAPGAHSINSGAPWLEQARRDKQ
ncbi:hypothetical protein [Ralstonia solanacearum]|uniref:hypothetical protein n=1 Tax=Ralstonia solanacearum TaxID=305 RepID=UPI00168BB69A|nr:hypothetical protein [Ralstonia solanacearum]QNT63170.1 hypothetical protein C2L97_26090 [Ralstonia solanacearum]